MAATDPTSERPFECWAVIRPDARGLSRAAAEAAAGPDDRVIHLVEVTGPPALDRAVQKAIAQAFGQLVALLADGMNCGECCGGGCRASQQALAIEDFGKIVRAAMGGRIPDEVPHD